MGKLQRALTWCRSNYKPTIVWFILVIITSILSIIIDRLVHQGEKALADKPYIAVVMSRKSIDFPIPQEFLQGFQEAFSEGKAYVESHDGEKIDIRIKEDLGSTDEAARIAHQLVDDKNCILVIGNSNSTLTDTTLDIFLRDSDPPSYILPIATANELITKADTGNHRGVLRMVPDNAHQADVIQKLVKGLAPHQRVAIYGDEENKFYSLNLSRDIASRIRGKQGKVLIEEMIGPTNSIYSSLGVWNLTPDRRPEVIIYVGVAHHGLLLIDQLSELKNISVPIIFTDGCMVSDLLTNISKIRNSAFVLSPVGTQKASNQLPTYEFIGKDAYSLAKRIFSAVSSCTRSKLREYLSASKGEIQVRGFAGEYRFGPDGNNNAMDYKVYEITRGDLKLKDDY